VREDSYRRQGFGYQDQKTPNGSRNEHGAADDHQDFFGYLFHGWVPIW